VARRYGFREVGAEELEALRACDTREVIRRLEVPAWKLPLIARHMRRLAAETEAPALFPGVADAFRALAARGVAVAILSSNGEPHVRRTLGPALAGMVDYYACGVSLFGKAAKLRRLLRDARVIPEDAILVGDETRDVAAARDVGVAAGVALWGYALPEVLEAQRPDRVFRRAEEMRR
jgi:phosphoglycolate phosphatase